MGVVGFCMGGQLALAAGSQNRRIGAVVDFYGIHPECDARISRAARRPVLAVFAENDDFIPPEAVTSAGR